MPKYNTPSGNITLDDKHYVAEGGEGRIYAKNGTAYKICFPGKMPPLDKLKELQILDQPYIIRPLEIINDNNGPVGYSMSYLDNSKVFSLSQLFTKSFRTRENINNQDIVNLVKKLKEGFEFVHSKRVLLVDANEFNFMVDRSLNGIYFIDTNSYQTQSYPATAIMSSIRDWETKGFNELTDWFSFAVLTFQMFVGIHPFRGGNHPSVTAKEPDLKTKERLLKHISVLNSGTKYPIAATQPIGCIPPAYLNWYKALFEQGKRYPPPDSLQQVINVIKTVVTSNGVIKYTSLGKISGKYVGFFDGVFVGETGSFGIDTPYNCNLSCLSLIENQPVVSNKGVLSIGNKDLGQYEKICGDYIKHHENIFKIVKIGNTFATKKVADCSLYTTKLFNGGFVQEWFSNNIFNIFGIGQYNINELKGHKVLEAYSEHGVLIISHQKKNDYFISRVELDGSSYTINTESYCDFYPVIAAIKPNKLSIIKIGDQLEIQVGSSKKVIQDDSLNDIVAIHNYKNTIYFLKGDGEILRGTL